MRAELDIRVAQMRTAADAHSDEVARLVLDAYALGRLDGLREGREIAAAEAASV